MFTKRDVNNLLSKRGAEKLFLANPGRPAMMDPATVKTVLEYLYWFGYLAYEATKDLTIEDIANALKKFQGWFGLGKGKEAGKIGPATNRAMGYPRCGCPDIIDENNCRHHEYVRLMQAREARQAMWSKRGLKYYIRSHVKNGGLSPAVQEQIIAGAWKAWTKVAAVQVSRTKTARQADLLIDTGKGPKDDFDGPAGTLAWAYMPDGRDQQLLMRFDLDELWINDSRDHGILMFNVACHEFGHMLGLDHSRKTQALMAPFYNESVGTPQPDDDIPRIQKLYGKPRKAALIEGYDTASEKGFVLRVPSLSVDGYRLVPQRTSAEK